MAEAGAWQQIREQGLLSTTALLDRYGYGGKERVSIESWPRPQIITIHDRITGATAQVRDNKPLRLKFLEACLTDMTVQQWCELLNRKVFFWVSQERLETLLSARAYGCRPHDVITIDTRALVERDISKLTLAPINTGATLYPTATPRGSETFIPIDDYPLTQYKRWRGSRDAIVELAADYEVQHIEDISVRVERRLRDTTVDVLWQAATEQ